MRRTDPEIRAVSSPIEDMLVTSSLASALAAADRAGLMSAPATAVAVRQRYRDGETEWVWRMLLQGRDHLRLMLAQPNSSLIGSWQAVPETTGSAGFDALLAALAQREFNEAGREAPSWTRVDPLPEPWAPEHPFLSRERVVATTPDWLRRLNIFVPARDLVTA